MRPIRLEMAAFGPYSGREHLDFTRLGTAGIYLVTGPTGAGKTSIFDAICYALFGMPSGNARETGMLRSLYAEPGVETYVELDFAYRDAAYRVRRVPAQERPKKRGAGVTTIPTDADFWRLGASGEPLPSTHVSSLKKVDQAITDLLGIGREQFMQIAMIAQGDFLRLLHAPTSQRIEIFRKIFMTRKYELLQERLKSEISEMKKRRETSEKMLRQIIADLEHRDDAAAEEAQLLSERIADIAGDSGQRLISLVEGEIEEDLRQKAELESSQGTLQKELSAVTSALGKAEEQEKARERLLCAERDRTDHAERMQQADRAYEQAKSHRPKIELLRAALITKTEGLERYDILGAQQENLQRLTEQCAQRQKELRAVQKALFEEEERLTEMKRRHEELAGAELAGEKLEHALNALRADQAAWEIRRTRSAQLADGIRSYHRAQEDYATKQRLADETAADFQEKNKRFLSAQAGIMAEALIPGNPCPVCGAVDHPSPAKLTEGAPAEADVERAKGLSEQAAKDASRASEAAAKLRGEIIQRAAQLHGASIPGTNAAAPGARGAYDTAAISATPDTPATPNACDLPAASAVSDLPPPDLPEILAWDSAAEDAGIEEELQRGAAEIREILREQTERRRDVQLRQTLGEEIPVLEQRLAAERESEQTIVSEIGRLEGEISSLERQVDDARRKLEFASREQAQEDIRLHRQQLRQLEESLAEGEAQWYAAREKLQGIDSVIETLRTQLDGADPLDSNTLRAQGASLRERSEALSREIAQVDFRGTVNRKALQRIRTSVEELRRMEAEYGWKQQLASTASGQFGGELGKVALETYVQIAYFERIIERANLRLMSMSGAQYELVRHRATSEETVGAKAGNRGQDGLELNVIDHYNGTRRSVKSLSGGESFMASLALALGLSDEIQSLSGGIQILSMFVDEGFGSLDDETLSRAIKVLSGIAESNLLIGIISHVGELRNRIERQIVVRKDRSSGSRVEIISPDPSPRTASR